MFGMIHTETASIVCVTRWLKISQCRLGRHDACVSLWGYNRFDNQCNPIWQEFLTDSGHDTVTTQSVSGNRYMSMPEGLHCIQHMCQRLPSVMGSSSLDKPISLEKRRKKSTYLSSSFINTIEECLTEWCVNYGMYILRVWLRWFLGNKVTKSSVSWQVNCLIV